MRKLFKSGIAAFIAVAMTAMSLTACGTSAPAGNEKKEEKAAEATEAAAEELKAEEGAEIEISYWEGSPSDKEAWDAIFAKLKEDHPEIKITAQAYPSGDYTKMLDTRIAGNDWPDVIRYAYQKIGKFKSADVMLDLTPYIEKENLDDISDAFLSACKYEDKLLALPHHTDVIAMFYNKKMFEESGIRIPSSPEDAYTWDEIKDIAKQLKDKYSLPYGCAGVWEMNNAYRFLPFIYMNGGAIMNEDQTEATWNTDEVKEALQFYDDLKKDDLIANNAVSGPATANSLFVSQQIAFDFAGSWHCSYIQENMPDNWGVTYMPSKNGKTGTDMGGNALFVYKETKYPKAAAIVASYITNAENMEKFCETGGFIPVRKSLIEKGIKYQKFEEAMKIFNELVLTIDPKMAADESSVVFQQINSAFVEELDPLAVDRSATPEQIQENMQRRTTEILAEQ